MKTKGDLLGFAIAFALRGASKPVRGLRQGLSEEERYRVADDVVDRLQKHGDPWHLSEDLPEVTGKGYSTPPTETPTK
jgi:hypothetical protein